MVRRRRLIFPDIQSRAGDLLRGQGGGEGVLIVNPAARRGDEEGVRLHHRELGFTHHPPGFRRMRAVDGDIVGGSQHVFHCGGLLGTLGGDLSGGLVGVVGDHPHLEQAAAQFSHAATDMAQADDADGAALNVVAHEVSAVVGGTAAHGVVGLDDAF